MKTIVLLISLCASHATIAQAYWQQEVNYKIDVELDDINHFLRAYEEFEYVNNSPDALSKLYIHLWPNAYKSGFTALAKQQYEQKDPDLRFKTEELGGYIDSLNFQVNGKPVQWELDPENPDIAIIQLPEALVSGGKIRVSTPFIVKLPSGSVSRLGHIGQSYQITQWYPKPAVYDKNGWNAMPYLNQGEFYSEYGSFDVSIRLPRNYVVGATGDLQTESELQFLDSIAAATEKTLPGADDSKQLRAKTPNVTPESSKEFKTIRYIQKNVHDFAWFADKRFEVLKSSVVLPHSGRSVTTWAMFTPKNASLWKRAPEYLNDAIHYYSLWNGDYPYQHVTAVDGTISAGGGMEYPNVTVIGNSSNDIQLEIVIVHEVGHNWFYGQLGTNERVHGWMDEGLNTLNEVRYMQTKYPDNTAFSDMVLNGRFHFNDLCHHDLGDVSYRTIAGFGEDQPIETHSAKFSSANYGIVMYQKTGLVFYYLMDYLGEELFDKCMQTYYDEWEYKHPTPADLRASLEKTSGNNLEWLFYDLIQTTNHIDYKLKKVMQTKNGYLVKTKNIGQVDGPIEISAIVGDSVVLEQWIEPGSKKNEITFVSGSLDKVMIDYGRDIPEMNRQNNLWEREGMFKRWEKIKFEYLIGDNEPDRTNIFWTPIVAGNIYDKAMIGALVHNYGVPFNPFTYAIAPMYSFGRNMVSGIGEFAYTSLPRKNLKLSRIGLGLRSFKNDSTYRNNESFYAAALPYWFAKIGNRKDNKHYEQNIRLQGMYRLDKMGPAQAEQAGAYLQYNFIYKRPDHKLRFSVRNEYLNNLTSEESYARIMTDAEYAFSYMKRNQKRWITLRVFAGQQYIRNYDFSTGYNYTMALSGASGSQDLFLDEFYFGRSEISGMWSQQRQENMGGFKTTSYYGTSSVGMAATNFYFQLPIPTGIFGVFADAGLFHNGISVQSAIQVGLGVKLGTVFGVYFPLWMSKELDDSFGNSSYAEKIRFTLNLNQLNKPLQLNGIL